MYFIEVQQRARLPQPFPRPQTPIPAALPPSPPSPIALGWNERRMALESASDGSEVAPRQPSRRHPIERSTVTSLMRLQVVAEACLWVGHARTAQDLRAVHERVGQGVDQAHRRRTALVSPPWRERTRAHAAGHSPACSTSSSAVTTPPAARTGPALWWMTLSARARWAEGLQGLLLPAAAAHAAAPPKEGLDWMVYRVLLLPRCASPSAPPWWTWPWHAHAQTCGRARPSDGARGHTTRCTSAKYPVLG